MKKKILFFGCGMIGIVILIFVVFSLFLTSSNSMEEIYLKYKLDVDAGVEYLMSQDSYKEKTDEEKIKEMKDLLTMYEKKNQIQNLYYDESGKMFTFQYQDGVLGGVMMKDFDPYLN